MRNAQLLDLFSGWEYQTQEFRRKWSRKIGEDIHVQYPSCPPGWESCKAAPQRKAVMVVGQRPGAWGATTRVLEGMELGRDFVDEDGSSRSDFFRFINEMERKINRIQGAGMKFCYWTNIFRMGTGNPGTNKQQLATNREFQKEYLDSIHTLPREIEIVEPDLILFCTGPDYDRYLQKIFSCTFSAVLGSTHDEYKYLARVHAASLPAKTFRTYNPSFLLARRKSFPAANRDNVDHLLAAIAARS